MIISKAQFQLFMQTELHRGTFLLLTVMPLTAVCTVTTDHNVDPCFLTTRHQLVAQ